MVVLRTLIINIIELKDKELSNITGGSFGENDNNYSIKVNSYTCSKQIAATLIKEVLNIGMKEAQELVDSFPKMILECVSSKEAQTIESRLSDSGIDAEIIRQ